MLVVLRSTAPAGIGDQVAAGLARRLADVGAVAPVIDVIPVARIDNEGGIAGKYALVKNVAP